MANHGHLIFHPVATSDIARRFGVSVAAISNYRARNPQGSPNPFPAPVFEVAGGTVPVFEWASVLEWAKARKTGIDGRFGRDIVVSD